MRLAFYPVLAAALLSSPRAQTSGAFPYAIGADLSYLKQQEDAGQRFSDGGTVKPALAIFKSHGYNWVRLRLFHTPTDLPNSLEYTLASAQRAKALGFRFLLDFHYSDTWADPNSQTMPRAWAGLSHDVLADSVFRYTRAALDRFYALGAAPDMVQIGNEINSGMLWPDGRFDSLKNLGDLLKAGIRGVDSAANDAAAYDAVQGNAQVSGNTQVTGKPRIMLHLACGGDTVVTGWFLDAMAAQGVVFDVIGQSYYPLWQGTPEDLARNLEFMGRRDTHDIVIVETAFSTYPDGKSSPFPLTDQGQADYLKTIDSLVRSAPNGRGKGLFWWEPTGDAYIGTPRGLFDAQRNARPAMRVFDGLVGLKRPAPARPFDRTPDWKLWMGGTAWYPMFRARGDRLDPAVWISPSGRAVFPSSSR